MEENTEKNSEEQINSNWKKKIENSLIWILLGVAFIAFEFGWQISGSITSKSFEGAIEEKNTRIESLQDERNKYKEALYNCENKAEKTSQEKLQLSDKLKTTQSTITKSQTQILNDTTICPGQAVPIFEQMALVNYYKYNDTENNAYLSIISEKLEIGDAFGSFAGPRQVTFTVSGKEYLLNCMGFDSTFGKGCIKISIRKK